MAAITRIAMKALKEEGGLDPGTKIPELRALGLMVGREFSSVVFSNDLEELLVELAEIWKRHSFGEMEIVASQPPTLLVSDCFDCLGRAYGVGVPICPFKEGLIEGVLNCRLRASFEVQETECCGTGAEACKFVLKQGPSPARS